MVLDGTVLDGMILDGMVPDGLLQPTVQVIAFNGQQRCQPWPLPN
jgi:hypothetical protein